MAASVKRYFEKLESNDFKPDQTEALTGDAAAIEALLLALRLTEGAECAHHKRAIELRSIEIQSLIDRELLIQECPRLKLTAQGLFFAETVFSELC